MKSFKCPIDGKKFSNIDSLIKYVEEKFPMNVPQEVTTKQYLFNVRNKYPINKTHGTSIISGKPTPWNEVKGRYERLVDEREKVQFRNLFVSRMKRKHGKVHLLNDPEQQKKMLAARKISGEYRFRDGTKFTFTGSYEEDFLKFLDREMKWTSEDIFAPAPMIFKYKHDGKEKFYIPDFYLLSHNLVVEIKSQTNNHYRKRDIQVEFIKDKILHESNYRYIKIYDKDYTEFIELINEIQ